MSTASWKGWILYGTYNSELVMQPTYKQFQMRKYSFVYSIIYEVRVIDPY